LRVIKQDKTEHTTPTNALTQIAFTMNSCCRGVVNQSNNASVFIFLKFSSKQYQFKITNQSDSF
jgi:hypothetical protein